ncbi:amino acid permease [Bacillus sp. BRMEA1]|uniref:amino acid permease n=1 Tax=Neobacillus endophyticus TaxID=2738405 RepID=UPI00156380D0|nr:amino acid permease [Neobacillus endophyticus]NRD78315.1 amino acid permease [Neobacillus endophyticus]
MSENTQAKELHRGLEERHINLMSLGAAIGVGLFLGSASAIKMAGPGIILAYALSGLIMFFIMRALGEMAIQKPVAGSFSTYARDYLGPLAGYITGWNYWFLWVVTCMAEITAVGVYMQYWFPNTSGWIWALVALIIMSIVNFLAVKLYGELEFWFALIKIITICAMILVGFGMILFGIGNGGVATGIKNLWSHGGLFPHGIKGLLMSLQMVMFAYLGIEVIGVTAGEVKNPEKTLARAVDSVFYRILIFYVGALFVIMSIYPWQEIGTKGSPFVLTFQQIGIKSAAGIINFVVLTAALSSCNSGIFSTGRMLFDLAHHGEAPKSLGKVTKSGVPGLAIIVSAAVLLIGVILNYMVPAKVFTWVTSIGTFTAIWTWGIILLSQLRHRKSQKPEGSKQVKYKLPLYPFSSYLSLAFLVLVLIVMGIDPDQRIAVIIGPVFILMLVAFYYIKGFNRSGKVNKNNKEHAG